MTLLQISLKAARVNADLSQEDVERETGISRRTIIRWENGESFPSENKLIVLCKLYGILPENIKRK